MSWITELFGPKLWPKAPQNYDEYIAATGSDEDKDRLRQRNEQMQADELARLIWHCKAAPDGMGRTPSLGMMEVSYRGAIIARVKMATTPLGSRMFDLRLPEPGSPGVLPLLDVFRHHVERERAEAKAAQQAQNEAAHPWIIDACKAYWEAQG